MRESLQNSMLDTLALLEPKSPACGKIRMGGDYDGGYVIANDLTECKICYSIGVGPQVKFDEELAELGVSIFQYDHTVDGLPALHDNFNYFKIGIAPASGENDEMISLDSMLKMNGHQDQENMFLKMDVEGAEWDVLDEISVSTLSKFDQIVVEFHGLRMLDIESFRGRAERVFKKLNFGHALCHIHGNNYGGMTVVSGVPIPDVIEVLYCRRGRFDVFKSADVYPTKLDQPCDPARPDLFLGAFKFK